MSQMKVKALLFICCIVKIAFGQVLQQNTPTLEAKNGINKFKLCSFYDIHKANLKEAPAQKDARIKWYNYTGTDVQTVFGSEILF